MSILDQLSSSVGVRTQEPNTEVAEKCLAEPELLLEITTGLSVKDVRRAGDCAEVMTKVAEKRPELVASHARALLALLDHKNGRVRWEAAHAFGLVASHVPDLVAKELASLVRIIRQDKSVIVRDYAIDAIANYATTGAKASKHALPVLREVLGTWNGKHAARILTALGHIIEATPRLASEVGDLAKGFEEHSRPGVRKAAKVLLKKTSAQPDSHIKNPDRG